MVWPCQLRMELHCYNCSYTCIHLQRKNFEPYKMMGCLGLGYNKEKMTEKVTFMLSARRLQRWKWCGCVNCGWYYLIKINHTHAYIFRAYIFSFSLALKCYLFLRHNTKKNQPSCTFSMFSAWIRMPQEWKMVWVRLCQLWMGLPNLKNNTHACTTFRNDIFVYCNTMGCLGLIQ